jgi:hypothetical protein
MKTSTSTSSAKKVVLALVALGVVYVVTKSRKKFAEHNAAPVPLDPDLHPAVRRAALAAIALEHDPLVLHELASKLDAAGHRVTSDVVRGRAQQVASLNGYGS